MNIHTLKNWHQTLLWFLVLTLATLFSPTAVNSGSPSVADGTIPGVRDYHRDASGNLAAMTDESGQVEGWAEVHPFGRSTATPPDHPLCFLGQYIRKPSMRI